MPVAKVGVVARQVLAVVLACLLSGVVHAQDVSWLYRVEVPVADQSPPARVQASRAALLAALMRLTGLAALPQSPRLSQALSSPDGYYTQFGYAPGTEPGTLQLVVQFSPPALQALIREAGLPVWPAARPVVLAWIIVDDGDDVRLVTGDGSEPVAAAVLARADERGLPLRFAELAAPEAPVDSATGELAVEQTDPVAPVSASVLLEAGLEALKAISRVDGADLFVVARVSFDATANWRADWTLYRPLPELVGRDLPDSGLPMEGGEPVPELSTGDAPAPAETATDAISGSARLPGSLATDVDADLAVLESEPERFEVAAANPAELGRVLIDQLVGLLLERYQVLAGGSELQRVVVSGLQRARDYAAVLRLFAAQEVIDDVSVVRVQGDSVEFALGTIADLERLQRLVTADGRLIADPDPPFAESGAGLALRWRGP